MSELRTSRGAARKAAAGRVRGAGLATGGAALLAAGVTVAAVAVSVGAGLAASGTISGCVNTTTRVLTVPKAGTSCPSGTTALAWNAQGPAGPAGWATILSGPRFHFSYPEYMTSDGTHIWIANRGSSTITEVDATTGMPVYTLPAAHYQLSQPQALAVDGGNVWVANFGNNSVTEFRASDGAFIRNLSGAPYGFDGPDAVAADGTHVWIANAKGNSLTEVSQADGSFITNIGGGSYNFIYPGALAFDGHHIWVANVSTLTEISASNAVLIRNIPAPGGEPAGDPECLLFQPTISIEGLGHLWVASALGNSVSELNTGGQNDGTLVQTISGGHYGFNEPAALAFDGHSIWVANAQNSSVTELNAADGSWMRTVSGDAYGFAGTYALAVAGSRVWVANSDANTLTGLPPE